jgi:hypothetical protein
VCLSPIRFLLRSLRPRSRPRSPTPCTQWSARQLQYIISPLVKPLYGVLNHLFRHQFIADRQCRCLRQPARRRRSCWRPWQRHIQRFMHHHYLLHIFNPINELGNLKCTTNTTCIEFTDWRLRRIVCRGLARWSLRRLWRTAIHRAPCIVISISGEGLGQGELYTRYNKGPRNAVGV